MEKSGFDIIAKVPKSMREEYIQYILAGDNPREWPLSDEITIRNTALGIMRRLALSRLDEETLRELGETLEEAKQKLLKKLMDKEL